MSFRIHPAAAKELEQAALYYADHAGRVVAMAFITGFERVTELSAGTATSGVRSSRDCALSGFVDSHTDLYTMWRGRTSLYLH